MFIFWKKKNKQNVKKDKVSEEKHMTTSFYSPEELLEIGFKSVGKDVHISRKTSIYTPEKMTIGNHVRIDDFCILSGYLELGNYIHIAAYCALHGGNEGIFLADYVGLSSRCTIFTTSDDYSGGAMTNPTVPEKYLNANVNPVHIDKHVILGSSSVILPGITLGEGCSFGSFSFISKSTEPWGMYAGIPCKRIKERKKELLRMAIELESD